MKSGKLFIFEGGEGSGKSTVVQEIGSRLKKEGVNCLVTREPGGSRAAEKVREVILNYQLQPLSQLLGFLLARSIWIDEVVSPALQKGMVVLSDRSYPSTYVYQGLVGGIDLSKIQRWHKEMLRGVEATATVIILNVESSRGLARSKSTGEVNIFEAQSLRFHRRINRGYLQLAQRYKWPVVDANRDLQYVIGSCWGLVRDKIRE